MNGFDKHRSRRRVVQRGFTLVEVLAALMIFSVAILGLSQASTQSLRTQSYLQSRMLAGIVADNVLTDIRHERRFSTGARKGSETQMGQTFDWRAEIAATDVNAFYRITVKVQLAGQEQVLVNRQAYRITERQP